MRGAGHWLRKNGLGGRGLEFSHGGISKKTNEITFLICMGCEEMLELFPIRSSINSINLS